MQDPMTVPSCVALIPARAGSKRVPGKNTRALGGIPLLVHTIRTAVESGIFTSVVVSTDSEATLALSVVCEARGYHRAAVNAGDLSPDFAWVAEYAPDTDCFAILRPTSPFRTAETIRRAWDQWLLQGERFDSLRAVELCRQHPGKMWLMGEEGRLERYDASWPDLDGQPTHSRPYQTLPQVYTQNASLEIAWTRVLKEFGNISGDRVLAFLTQGREGFDINTEDDWAMAEHLIATGQVVLHGA